MRHQYEPLSFCLNFLSLPLLLIPCFRCNCFTLQPDRESDQKPKCRTHHALLIIFGFRALLMSRRLVSHNSKVCQTQRPQFAESHDRDDRAPGIYTVPLTSLMFACVTRVCQLVHEYPLYSSRLIFSLVKTSAAPPTWCLYLAA